jgi:thiamine biosynthesis lipoprotein
VSITNQAFATSGDYRNFFERDGVRYSHVIDPRTGYPVSNGVVSVSIIADNCTLADGLATALMVMGAEKGIRLVDQLADLEAFIVVEKSDGNLVDYSSRGFKSDTPPK